MKIIDFECKGNVVRFYLGKDNEKDYHGDDWNDTPYECNAGTVYDQYIAGTADVVFPYDALVLEPCDGVLNSHFCKDDMKAGVVPCIVVVPPEMAKDAYRTEFDYWATCKGVIKFYFNDRMEPIDEPALYTFDTENEWTRNENYSVFVTRRSDQAVGGEAMKEIPVWEKANLTIDEAAEYFNIGKNKLSEMTKMRNCPFVLHIGARRVIKRKQMEIFLEEKLVI